MILALIKMNVRPEKRKELLQTLQSIVAQMRKKNGCVDSNFYRNAENEKEGDLGYHVIKISEHGVKVSKSDLKIHIGAFKGNSNGVNHCRKN